MRGKVANIWFSSDWHLWHDNIIQYGERPFSNTKEMFEAILTYHNEVVKPQDKYYNLGDVVMWRGKHNRARFVDLIHKFNGHKRLILGNHDHYPVQTYLEAGFEKVMAVQRLEGVWFTHIPIHPMSLGRTVGNAHGHIHQHPAFPPVETKDEDGNKRVRRYLNLSVEAINYKPVSLDWVKEQLRVQ